MSAAADVRARLPGWAAQFRGLEGRDPGLWPPLPRALCILAMLVGVIAGGGWFVWSGQWQSLDEGRLQEQRLRDAYAGKLAQVQHLDGLRQQKAAVEAMVEQLEKQLPGKAEMDALLAEISRAGALRGLQFELFRPGQVKVGDYYAELPVEIRLNGPFHSLAGFVSNVTNLRRIVSIDRIGLERQRDGMLAFECIAHAYRYLEDGEQAGKRPGKGRR